jgi:hypothetical protein
VRAPAAKAASARRAARRARADSTLSSLDRYQGISAAVDKKCGMEFRKERVVLETQSHRVVGDLHLPKEGYLSRLSDFLNRNELRFITLTDVTVLEHTESGATVTSEHEFIAIGADHVQFAYPDVGSEA